MGVVNIIERKMDTKLTAVPRFSVARDCASKGRYTAYGVTVFPLTIRKKEERMKKTKKYQLSQWEKSDRIVMEDFNSDNAKVEAALTAHDTTLASLSSGKADKTVTTSLQTQLNAKADKSTTNSLQTQVDARTIMSAGAYTGDSDLGATATRTISLGFTPKAVLVTRWDGVTHEGAAYYGGLAVAGPPADVSPEYPVVEIVDGGFRVYCSQNPYICANYTNYRYRYVAFV